MRDQWVGLVARAYAALRGRYAVACLFTALTALILFLPLGEAWAVQSKVEAENTTLSGNYVVVHASNTASGGRDVVFGSNGAASRTFSGAATKVSLRARGEACNGAPQLKVYVDGVLKGTVTLTSSTFANYAVDISGLSEGTHTLRISFENDYYASSGCDRNAYLDYYELTLPDATPPSACSKGQFFAEYRNELKTFGTQPALARCETTINNDWSSGSPASGINANSFTARWVGTFDFEGSDYEFMTTADDGVRVWVDGELLIDQWKDQGATTYKATRTMAAGAHQVRVEYYENAGLSVAKIAWTKSTAAGGTTLYASPSGDGTTCSQAAPCSLSGARDKVRTMNASMSADITVFLRGGTYRLGTPLVLNNQDSGTGGFDVVYKAYPGENPVLDGGQPIGPFSLYNSANNVFRASVPSTFDTREVWVNGTRAQRARGQVNPGGFTKTSNGYTTTNTQMANWRNPSDIEMVGEAEWNQHRCSVASISGSTIVMDQPCWQNVNDHGYQPANMGAPTYVENAYELLDSPGEWYLDKAGDYLYYIPRSGETMASAGVVAGATERLVFIDGAAANDVRNIRFEGITFRHTGWTAPNSQYGFAAAQGGTYDVDPVGGGAPTKMIPAAVAAEFARGIEFHGNIFEHLATTAIHMQDGVKDGVVVGNRVEDVGGGGLYLGNHNQPHPSADYLIQNNRLNNNYIRKPAAQYAVSHGIWLAYTDTTYVQHNEIVNSPYTPISSGWGWGGSDPSATRNVHIDYNRLDGYLQTMKDGGGVYTLGEHPSSTVTRNYMRGGVGRFGGLYPDEGSEFITWRYNVIDGAYRWLHIHTGGICNNTITNNYANVTAQLINNSCNTINSNVFVTGDAWPTEAQNTMNAAGLEAPYRGIGG
jgi:hypothetical protein